MNFDFERIYSNINNQAYVQIGSGSGRLVFDLDHKYVVKLAKNKKGLAQNRAEHQIYSNAQSYLFAKIFKVSDDNKLLVMEKAEIIYKISEVWKSFHVNNNKEFIRLKEIRSISKQYGLVPADLIRAVNWGKVGGKPVIIDYGFTWSVKRKYYGHF